MKKILISACLLGDKVRYDGKDSLSQHPMLKCWAQEGRLVKICHEMAGGLPSPRAASEIQGSGGGVAILKNTAKVITDHDDVTEQYVAGAQKALLLAKQHHIKIAILKARSPSCGNKQIYDGTHGRKLVDGMGVTAALLKQNGISVFNEDEIELASLYLNH